MRQNLIEIIEEMNQNSKKNKKHFYMSPNIDVYIKDPISTEIDIENILKFVEQRIPDKFLYYIDSIIIGQFDELDDREVNAMYKDGTIYLTNEQDDEKDIVDDIIHEIGHAVIKQFGSELFLDSKLENEFLGKRRRLQALLTAHGISTETGEFENLEYSKRFDYFLYKEVGYDMISNIAPTLFVSSYGATSLDEYFAEGFETYYFGERHELKQISYELYKKILALEEE